MLFTRRQKNHERKIFRGKYNAAIRFNCKCCIKQGILVFSLNHGSGLNVLILLLTATPVAPLY